MWGGFCGPAENGGAARPGFGSHCRPPEGGGWACERRDEFRLPGRSTSVRQKYVAPSRTPQRSAIIIGTALPRVKAACRRPPAPRYVRVLPPPRGAREDVRAVRRHRLRSAARRPRAGRLPRPLRPRSGRSSTHAPTSLIPAYFGGRLIVCGLRRLEGESAQARHARWRR